LIIKFSLVRLSIIFLLVIIFPLVQKQWLNLYLFNINNFTIYKLLYYLSGLTVPIFVVINSLNKFTYYKFSSHNKTNINNINGKLLLFITFIVLTTLSILISSYFFGNLKIFLHLFISNNEYLTQFDIDKKILFVVIISILLIFDRTKYFIKKIVLVNFLIFTIFSWYSKIDNSFLIDIIPFYIFKFGNTNFINLTILLSIETVFYLWSYISYSSNLSDWKVPKPSKKEVLPIFNILFFYLLIKIYYSILFK